MAAPYQTADRPDPRGKHKFTPDQDKGHVKDRRVLVGRDINTPVVIQKDVQLDQNSATGFSAAETYQIDASGNQISLGDNLPAGVANPSAFSTMSEPAISSEAPAAQTPSHSAIQSVAFTPASAPPPQQTKKTQVQLKSPGLGRLIVFCDAPILSDNLVVLPFSQDGSTAIAIPPEGPLTVIMGKDSYECLSGEWTFENAGKLYLVLVRADAAK